MPEGVRVAEPGTFGELADLVAGAGAVIGHSSCVVILAAMMGKPTIAVHGKHTDEAVGVHRMNDAAVDLKDASTEEIEQLVWALAERHCKEKVLLSA